MPLQQRAPADPEGHRILLPCAPSAFIPGKPGRLSCGKVQQACRQPRSTPQHHAACINAQLTYLFCCVQEGEDPALAQPVTENLNAVLQLLEYNAVRLGHVGWGRAMALTKTEAYGPRLQTYQKFTANISEMHSRVCKVARSCCVLNLAPGSAAAQSCFLLLLISLLLLLQPYPCLCRLRSCRCLATSTAPTCCAAGCASKRETA